MEARVRLSPRLAAVADAVVAGHPMADIGTDHARLPAHLVQSGRVPNAIACDVAEGPLVRARQTLREFSGPRIELRQGYGLRVLAPGEVATCVLAGMGGHLMRQLVDDALEVVASLDRLVLQPNTDWPGTRAWIAARGWTLTDERIACERRHHYLILVVDPRTRETTDWSPEDVELGPLLRRRREPSWHAWLLDQLARRERALSRARTTLSTDDPRVRELADAIDHMRDAIESMAPTSAPSRAFR
jgi:tRNA (adenine22-N1)-methyltransferase